ARVGELLLDERARGADVAPPGENAPEAATPREPGVHTGAGQLVAGPLVVGDGLVVLAAGGGELAQPEVRDGGHRAADPEQAREVAGVRRGAAQVAEGEPAEQAGQRDRGSPGVVEVVAAASTIDDVHGVGDAALRQRVAGLSHNTGGVVRRYVEHA